MAGDFPHLELEAVIGFNGHVFSGLGVHPNKKHLIYPLGCTVILKEIGTGKQEFLHGHTNNVSCISVSKSGHYIATGQVNFFGFKANIIIWDYAKRAVYTEFLLHMAKVESLAISPNDKYLVSLGGQDDGSIIVWNIETKQAICGSAASPQSAGFCFTVKYSNLNDDVFVSAGCGTLRVWELDLCNRKIRPTECNTGKLRRTVKCLEISENDQFIFCGTTTGDIMTINLKTTLLIDYGPIKNKYSVGVNVINMLPTGDLLVGSGSGTVALCSGTTFQMIKDVELEEGVTSIVIFEEGKKFFVGTVSAELYSVTFENFKQELIFSSHSNPVNDVAIPFGTSELFATCSQNDIRLWHIDRPKELLRIIVPNMTCNALDFMVDGHSIISAWNDGKIRVFGPESGKLLIIIHDAHRLGVTAIAGTKSCKRIVSGGGEGQVRVWELHAHGHRLLETMKEHKAAVTSIKITHDDKECVTASADGSCVVWDIVRFVGINMIIANTVFKTVCYHPEEYQIITSGTDRKVAYWEVYDGSVIREVEGSKSGALNGMHITQDGRHFVTGGDDKLVKVWDYAQGQVTHVGIAHGGSITSTKICCNNRILVSTSADGAILRWRFPHPLAE
ncbi:unnamed protein product [Ophioblennius macclurei]